MVGDLFQNYLVVDLLIFVVVVLFTGLSQSHDIPVSVAKARAGACFHAFAAQFALLGWDAMEQLTPMNRTLLVSK